MNSPSVAPMPVTRQAPPEPDPRDERDLQLTVCVERATDLAMRAKHYDAGGSGLGNVSGVSALERAEVRALASRFVASVRPSALDDVTTAVRATLAAAVRSGLRDVAAKHQDHSEARHLIDAVLEDVRQALCNPYIADATLGAQTGVLDARIVRAVRYPLAIATCGVTAILDQDDKGWLWKDLAPVCESCGELLTDDHEEEGRPVIQHDQALAPAVQCQKCGSLFEIGPAVVRERGSR